MLYPVSVCLSVCLSLYLWHSWISCSVITDKLLWRRSHRCNHMPSAGAGLTHKRTKRSLGLQAARGTKQKWLKNNEVIIRLNLKEYKFKLRRNWSLCWCLLLGMKYCKSFIEQVQHFKRKNLILHCVEVAYCDSTYRHKMYELKRDIDGRPM